MRRKKVARNKMKGVIRGAKGLVSKSWARGHWIKNIEKKHEPVYRQAIETADKQYQKLANEGKAAGVNLEFIAAYEFGKNASPNAKCEVCYEGAVAVASGREGLTLSEALAVNEELNEFVRATESWIDDDPYDEDHREVHYDSIPDFNDGTDKKRVHANLEKFESEKLS